jgi:hypothetical protein
MQRIALAVLVILPGCQLLFPTDGFQDSAPSDASTPEASSPEAASTTFCASTHPDASLCADFDEGDLLAGWTGRSESNGSIRGDDASYRSAPRSLSARWFVEPVGSSSTPVVVERAFSTPLPTRLRVEAKLRWDMPDNETVQPLQLSLGGHILTLGFAAAVGAYVEERLEQSDGGVLLRRHDFPALVAARTWYEVVLDVDLDAASINLKLSGAPAGPSARIELPASATPEPPQLKVGVVYTNVDPGTAVVVNVDDIVLTP